MIQKNFTIRKNKPILALVGMTGCGKTSVGRILAKRLAIPFIDLDAEIVTRFGDIKKIFAEQGEEEFRKREYCTLCSLLDRYSVNTEQTSVTDSLVFPSLILATGGGVPTYRPSFHLLKKHTAVVWLWRNPNEIPSDSPIFSRPPINGNIENYRKLLAERIPLYRSIADMRIVNRYPHKTAVLLADIIRQAVSAVDNAEVPPVRDGKEHSVKSFSKKHIHQNSNGKKRHQNTYQRRYSHVKENSENPLARTGENHDGNGTRR